MMRPPKPNQYEELKNHQREIKQREIEAKERELPTRPEAPRVIHEDSPSGRRTYNRWDRSAAHEHENEILEQEEHER